MNAAAFNTRKKRVWWRYATHFVIYFFFHPYNITFLLQSLKPAERFLHCRCIGTFIVCRARIRTRGYLAAARRTNHPFTRKVGGLTSTSEPCCYGSSPLVESRHTSEKQVMSDIAEKIRNTLLPTKKFNSVCQLGQGKGMAKESWAAPIRTAGTVVNYSFHRHRFSRSYQPSYSHH
jgi:hypothetical protein